MYISVRGYTRVIPERSGSKLEKTSLRAGVRDRPLTGYIASIGY